MQEEKQMLSSTKSLVYKPEAHLLNETRGWELSFPAPVSNQTEPSSHLES